MTSRTSARRPLDFVVIGASAGASGALSKIVSALPGGFPLPLLAVVHMPEMFTRDLAAQLAAKSRIEVMEAADLDLLTPGKMLVAPGGRHLLVRRNDEAVYHVVLDDGPPVNSCRPSIDVTLKSIAGFDDAACLVAILTGMGCDGAAGIRALKERACCHCLVQSPATCLISSMPDSVIEQALDDEVVDIDDMAERIAAVLARRG